MATVHRAHPSMGLQHELYRRSHRVPPSDEVHPERLLDMLSMECQRRKHETAIPMDLSDNNMDLDTLVDEFKIDDSISECFAHLEEERSSSKQKKSKTNVKSTGSPLKELLGVSVDGVDKSSPYRIPGSKSSTSANNSRFRLPSAVRIRLRMGKKFKRQPSVIETTPYSPIEEIPEEEASSHEQPIGSPLDSTLTNENVSNQSILCDSQAVAEISSNNTDSKMNSLESSLNEKEETVSNSLDVAVEIHAVGTQVKEETTQEEILEMFLDSLHKDISKSLKEAIPLELLNSGLLASWRDDRGNSILHRSIMAGNSRLLTDITEMYSGLFLERNNAEELPLDLAVQTGQCQCLRDLLGFCSSRTEYCLSTDDLERLITIAIVGNQTECLSYLLSVYCEMSEKRHFSVDKAGNSPAHIASKLGRLHCLYMLHITGFDVTKCNSDGIRPLQTAHNSGQRFCFKFLLQLETEAKLLGQIVCRACTIDRYEMFSSSFRQYIQNEVQRIEENLSQFEENLDTVVSRVSSRVKSACEAINENNSTQALVQLEEIAELAKSVKHCHPSSDLRYFLRETLQYSIKLDKLQGESEIPNEIVVDDEERNVIIGSIQSEIESSIRSTSYDKPEAPECFHNIQMSSVMDTLPKGCDDLGRHSFRNSNVTESSGTNHDADDESTTSNLSRQNVLSRKESFQTQHTWDQFEESSDENESSRSSSSEDGSPRKWNKFTCSRLKEQPSKMVYGMLIPDINNQDRPSSPRVKAKHRSRGPSGKYQKRQASVWDLRELEKRKSKTPRVKIPFENLPDDLLMEHRIQTHMKESVSHRADLVETITMASGEVFTEERNRPTRFVPPLPKEYDKRDNPYRRQKVQYSSDEICNQKIPTTPSIKTPENKQSTGKTKINIRGLISKLAKKPKRTGDNEKDVISSRHRDKNVKTYTQSEFAERYKKTSPELPEK